MAPLDFKHFTSVDYKPGEDDAIKYYAQKRKKQYHGNESVQSANKESSFGDNSFAARLIKIRNHPKVKAARKAHAAGEWDGNVDKEGEAVVHINGKPHTVTNKYSKKKEDVDEALNLQQRMKRSRLMKRMKSRIAIGRKRAMKKMANKKTI